MSDYIQVVVTNGSTLDALVRRVGLLLDLPKHPLAGRMMALLDVTSHLPLQLWYTEDEQAHDQRFWQQILAVVQPGTLLLLDLGITNNGAYGDLIAQDVTFVTRSKSNAVYQLKQGLHQSAHLRDSLVMLGQEQLPMGLVEAHYQR